MGFKGLANGSRRCSRKTVKLPVSRPTVNEYLEELEEPIQLECSIDNMQQLAEEFDCKTYIQNVTPQFGYSQLQTGH